MPLLRLFDFRAFRTGGLSVLGGLLAFLLPSRVVDGIEVRLRLYSHVLFVLIYGSLYLRGVVSRRPVDGTSVQSDGVSSRSAVTGGVIRAVRSASHSSSASGRSPSSAVSADSGDAVSSAPLVWIESAISGASASSRAGRSSRASGVTVGVLGSRVRVAARSCGSAGVSLAPAAASAASQDVRIRSDRSTAASAASSEYVPSVRDVHGNSARERDGVSAVPAVVAVSVSSVPARSEHVPVVYEGYRASYGKGSDGYCRHRRVARVYRHSRGYRDVCVQRHDLVPSCRDRLRFEIVIGRIRADRLVESERGLRARRRTPIRVPRVIRGTRSASVRA